MIYSSEHFSVDTGAYRLERGGEFCTLEPQVFDLIVYLIENRDRVVSRDELLDKLWHGRIVTDSAINARIKLARKALGDDGKQQQIIKTIHRRGYQFIGNIDAPSQSERQSHNQPPAQQTSSRRPSIAVLPFACSSGTTADRNLAEGLSTIVIANLSCYRELLVIDPESAFNYREGVDDIVDFADRLDVDYVVNGSVRHSGNRVRVSVQLIAVDSNTTIWVQRLDRTLDDIFDLEDEVASQVAVNLVGQIDDKNRSLVRFQRPEKLGAFDCVVRARPLVESLQQEENLAARKLLQKALELDPGYATACAYLALNHCAEIEGGWSAAPDRALQQAEQYAKQAIELDPFDSNAHVAMGAVLMNQQKFDLAIVHLDQAIECNPNCYNAFCHKSWVLAMSGRGAEVEACGATALRLNPLAPDSCLMAIMLGHYTRKKYGEALDILARLQEPFADTEAFRALCLFKLGREQESQQAAAHAIELGGEQIRQPDWLNNWRLGNPADHQQMIDELTAAGVLMPSLSAGDTPSIAVLQFRNLSQDPEQAYFSEGMALNICSRLSRIRSLLVKPAFSYEAARVAGPELAAKLDVGYLLAGSVQRDGARVRVSVELIDGETGAIKWSEQFDRSGDAIIDIQDDIAGAVTGTLWSYSGTLREAEHERLANKPTRDFNAFDYILKGIHYKDKFTREAALKAHRCFDRAIELDPRSAEACGWSAWEHIMDILMGWTDDNADSLRKAYATARSAIANDPHNEMGHWALAEALILDDDYERGIREYDRAMEINPNNPDLIANRGLHEAVYDRSDAGIGMIRQAIERNRHHPDWYFWALGIACFAAGRLAEAIDALERMTEQNTDTLAYLVSSLAHSDRPAEARERLAELQRLDPGFDLDAVSRLHTPLRGDARNMLLDGLRIALDSEKPRLKSVR